MVQYKLKDFDTLVVQKSLNKCLDQSGNISSGLALVIKGAVIKKGFRSKKIDKIIINSIGCNLELPSTYKQAYLVAQIVNYIIGNDGNSFEVPDHSVKNEIYSGIGFSKIGSLSTKKLSINFSKIEASSLIEGETGDAFNRIIEEEVSLMRASDASVKKFIFGQK